MRQGPFDRDEQQFMADIGLEPNDLEIWLAEAPTAPVAVQRRLRSITRQKLGLSSENQARTKARRRRWLPAVAAAAALLLAGIPAARLPAVQGALQRIFQFVPGIGIVETHEQTMVLAEPAVVRGEQGTLTVTALLSTSDRTEVRFRIDGFAAARPPHAERLVGPVEAALILPDGRSLAPDSTFMSGGPGSVQGTLMFPALGGPVKLVTLQLGAVHGMTEPFDVALELIDVADAGLTEAGPGGWSVMANGVLIGVPQAAFASDRIVLQLEAVVEQQGARIEAIGDWFDLAALEEAAREHDHIAIGEASPIRLVDDLGNNYPLLPGESNLHYNTGDALAATFAGPVHPDATALSLTVSSVQVLEEGTARFRMPLSALPLGDAVEVNEPLQVGRRRVVIRSVTRTAADRFLLDVDLGSAQGGTLLQYITITPYRGSGSSVFTLEPTTSANAKRYEVDFTPKGRFMDLEIVRPMVRVAGPWQVEVPLPR